MTIRSELMIYDMQSGKSRVVYQTPKLIEAPNWSPDGGFLLVNGDGLLFRFDLATGAFDRVETGFARAMNNDHGISPDGRRIAISDKTQTGDSCIYTLPIAGGDPERVTEAVPSYWHGWSPDGKTLAYCARRGGVFGITTCPVSGGAEMRLTPPKGHSDGPDYTPDGKWIWFNSSMGGTMQLWRIRPDGTGAEQMTSDDKVNWFPHPAPNGRDVLYLAYPPGTEQHPRDLNVELRLISADGGVSRRLVSLFGGQGTINTPCWAPDGAQFAYMRYHPVPD